jgi:hypothetical protein
MQNIDSLLEALLAVHNLPISQNTSNMSTDLVNSIEMRNALPPVLLNVSGGVCDDTRAQNEFERLSIYPTPIAAVRYPKPQVFSRSRYNSSIHDMIYANMAEIVPNIDIGYHVQTFTPANLAEWVNSTKTYYNTMNNLFQKKCDDQLAKLNRIEDHKIKCASLDMSRINRLPEDIVLYIRQFLLPESRIDELLAKYPDYIDTLKKMSVAKLRKLFMRGIYTPYYLQIITSSQNRERIKCIQPTLIIRSAFKNRTHCANEIRRIFEACRNAIPNTPEEHIYFQKKTLKILQVIVYVAYHRATR